MRETKFRVWDMHYNRYEERPCTVNKQGILFIYNVDEGHWFEPQHTVYTVEWFTGLKDKKRTEIYYDDYFEYSDNAGQLSFRVIWDNDKQRSQLKRKDVMYNFNAEIASWGEVIGNIHEPELLDKREQEKENAI